MTFSVNVRVSKKHNARGDNLNFSRSDERGQCGGENHFCFRSELNRSNGRG